MDDSFSTAALYYHRDKDSPMFGEILKAHTHKQIFTEPAVELAESADCTMGSVIVGGLPLSNMFDILNPLEYAAENVPTIAFG